MVGISSTASASAQKVANRSAVLASMRHSAMSAFSLNFSISASPSISLTVIASVHSRAAPRAVAPCWAPHDLFHMALFCAITAPVNILGVPFPLPMPHRRNVCGWLAVYVVQSVIYTARSAPYSVVAIALSAMNFFYSSHQRFSLNVFSHSQLSCSMLQQLVLPCRKYTHRSKSRHHIHILQSGSSGFPRECGEA